MLDIKFKGYYSNKDISLNIKIIALNKDGKLYYFTQKDDKYMNFEIEKLLDFELNLKNSSIIYIR